MPLDPHATPRPQFRAPRTQQEISDAERDGDPMTGLAVQTAFDGSAIDEARLRANFDGDAMTHDPSEGSAQEIAAAALDGNPMTRPAKQSSHVSDAIDQVERRHSNDSNPFEGENRRVSRLPTPWDMPSPRPRGY